MDGKPKMTWRAKGLAEAFSVPYNFTHDGHKFTLKLNINEADKEMGNPLSLDIDGKEFSRHPFLPSDFILDG